MSDPSSPQPFPEKRSALRTAVPVEVVLRCQDKSGKSFIEKTRTVDISRTGAKALTEHDISDGARLQMAVPEQKRMSWATVARIGNKAGNLQEIGIALDDTGGFWGVRMPDEALAREDAGAVPKQGGSGGNGSGALSLAEELLASARQNQSVEPEEEDGPTVQEQVRSAIEQYVGEALQVLNEQAGEIMKNLQETMTQQTEEYLRQRVEAAVRQVEAAAEAAALNVMDRSRPVWEEQIQSLTDSAREQLRARLAEHEASLATSAAKARRDLARKLADLSSAVGED